MGNWAGETDNNNVAMNNNLLLAQQRRNKMAAEQLEVVDGLLFKKSVNEAIDLLKNIGTT